MGKLFGTDGVRGVANGELSPELAFKLGMAGAVVLTRHAQHAPRILLGKDTRLSCAMLDAALTAGMCAMGAWVYDAGVIPTPGVAYAVRNQGYDAGVMISASHNTFEDNGIKFFSSKGYKLDDGLEDEIEALILQGLGELPRPTHAGIGNAEADGGKAKDAYACFLTETARRELGQDKPLAGMVIALDCANGATYQVAEDVFTSLGAQLHMMHSTPDGTNINADCGSTHMDGLVETVCQTGADIGIAFDGDGDRSLFVDERGRIVGGDEVLSICAGHMRAKGRLARGTLVATVMSNLGLSVMCEAEGIRLEKTSVGDRYVLEHMLAGGYNLGGEQSGHIIFLDDATTGDGILTAIKLLCVLLCEARPLSAANCRMQLMPQVLVNVPVDNGKKNSHLGYPEIRQEISVIESDLGGHGRLLVRPSGTEALIRIMLEGRDHKELERYAQRLARLVKQYMS